MLFVIWVYGSIPNSTIDIPRAYTWRNAKNVRLCLQNLRPQAEAVVTIWNNEHALYMNQIGSIARICSRYALGVPRIPTSPRYMTYWQRCLQLKLVPPDYRRKLPRNGLVALRVNSMWRAAALRHISPSQINDLPLPTASPFYKILKDYNSTIRIPIPDLTKISQIVKESWKNILNTFFA